MSARAGGIGMKTRCKHGDMYLEPRCYRPPFDEAMRIDERIYILMEFLRKDDNKMALKQLEKIRGILDKVEAKIKEYMSEEAEG